MLDFIVYFAMKGMSRTTLSLVGGWPQTWYDIVSNCPIMVYMKRNVNADVVKLISVFRIGMGLDVIHMWLSLLQECCVYPCVCSSRQVANIRTVDQRDDTNTDSYIMSRKRDLN